MSARVLHKTMMPHTTPVCSPVALEAAFRGELEGLWPEGVPRKLLVAVSGGSDSTALAWLCRAQLGRFLEGLALAHFHHHLRGEEADEDEAFVRDLAARLAVPYRRGDWVRVSSDHPAREDRNLQAAARRARYGFLTEAARDIGFPVVATGHQREDQIETVLLNLARGGGAGAYRGIRERMRRGELWLLRPLLALTRMDLRAYLDHRGGAYREDSSNASTKYTRNRLRLEHVPSRTESDPGFIRNLLEAHARAKQAEASAIESLVSIRSVGIREGGRWVLPRAPFDAMGEDARFFCLRELLRELLPEGGGWYPTRRAPLRMLFELLSSGARGVVNLPKGLRAEVTARTLTLTVR